MFCLLCVAFTQVSLNLPQVTLAGYLKPLKLLLLHASEENDPSAKQRLSRGERHFHRNHQPPAALPQGVSAHEDDPPDLESFPAGSIPTTITYGTIWWSHSLLQTKL